MSTNNEGSDGLSKPAPVESEGVCIVQIPGSFPGQTEPKATHPCWK